MEVYKIIHLAYKLPENSLPLPRYLHIPPLHLYRFWFHTLIKQILNTSKDIKRVNVPIDNGFISMSYTKTGQPRPNWNSIQSEDTRRCQDQPCEKNIRPTIERFSETYISKSSVRLCLSLLYSVTWWQSTNHGSEIVVYEPPDKYISIHQLSALVLSTLPYVLSISLKMSTNEPFLYDYWNILQPYITLSVWLSNSCDSSGLYRGFKCAVVSGSCAHLYSSTVARYSGQSIRQPKSEYNPLVSTRSWYTLSYFL